MKQLVGEIYQNTINIPSKDEIFFNSDHNFIKISGYDEYTGDSIVDYEGNIILKPNTGVSIGQFSKNGFAIAEENQKNCFGVINNKGDFKNIEGFKIFDDNIKTTDLIPERKFISGKYLCIYKENILSFYDAQKVIDTGKAELIQSLNLSTFIKDNIRQSGKISSGDIAYEQGVKGDGTFYFRIQNQGKTDIVYDIYSVNCVNNKIVTEKILENVKQDLNRIGTQALNFSFNNGIISFRKEDEGPDKISYFNPESKKRVESIPVDFIRNGGWNKGLLRISKDERYGYVINSNMEVIFAHNLTNNKLEEIFPSLEGTLFGSLRNEKYGSIKLADGYICKFITKNNEEFIDIYDNNGDYKGKIKYISKDCEYFINAHIIIDEDLFYFTDKALKTKVFVLNKQDNINGEFYIPIKGIDNLTDKGAITFCSKGYLITKNNINGELTISNIGDSLKEITNLGNKIYEIEGNKRFGNLSNKELLYNPNVYNENPLKIVESETSKDITISGKKFKKKLLIK